MTQPKQPSESIMSSENKSKTKLSGGARFMLSLTFLVAVSGAGLSAFIAWQGLERSKQINAQIVEAKNLASSSQQQLNTLLNQRLAALQSAFNNQHQETNKAIQGRLTQLDNKITEVSGQQSSDWIIAEAIYLTRLAQQQINVQHDVQTAQHLLLNADQRLSELSHPKVFSVRKLITQDIATLSNTPTYDPAKPFGELLNAIHEVQQLQVKTLDIPDAPLSTASMSNDWLENLKHSVTNFFAHIFRINHYEGSIEPYKSPAVQQSIKSNIIQQLQMAQIAVLDKQPTVYKQAIAQASSWLQQHFDTNTTAVSQLVRLLTMLEKQPIARASETTLLSHQALETLFSQYNPLAPNTESTKEDTTAQTTTSSVQQPGVQP